MNTIAPDRVHSLVETHLDNLIADIQKELAVETGEAIARFFSGLKREALVTIISADMQRYANFACGDARDVGSTPMTRHVRRWGTRDGLWRLVTRLLGLGLYPVLHHQRRHPRNGCLAAEKAARGYAVLRNRPQGYFVPQI